MARRGWAMLGVVLALAGLPVAARAQSMPSTPATGETRLVRITQLGPAGQPMETPTEVACPSSGCQTMLPLTIDSLGERFLLSIQFVGKGAYVTLMPLSIGTSEILDFEKGRPGAIFVPMNGLRQLQVELSFIIVRAPSIRALEPDHSGQTLASGNVFNRKRKPDVVLQIGFSPSGG